MEVRVDTESLMEFVKFPYVIGGFVPKLGYTFNKGALFKKVQHILNGCTIYLEQLSGGLEMFLKKASSQFLEVIMIKYSCGLLKGF